MHEPDFDGLARRLRRAGMAPRRISRVVAELEAHHADLVDSLVREGAGAAEAGREAHRLLGDLDRIGRDLASRPELRAWYYRWPWLGRIALPIACVAALPIAPVFAGYQHARELLRWGICILASGVFTLLLMAALQYSIYSS